jgi:hypothetical protein
MAPAPAPAANMMAASETVIGGTGCCGLCACRKGSGDRLQRSADDGRVCKRGIERHVTEVELEKAFVAWCADSGGALATRLPPAAFVTML